MGWVSESSSGGVNSRGVVGLGTCADREATTADYHCPRERPSARVWCTVVTLELTGWGMLGQRNVRHGVG